MGESFKQPSIRVGERSMTLSKGDGHWDMVGHATGEPDVARWRGWVVDAKLDGQHVRAEALRYIDAYALGCALVEGVPLDECESFVRWLGLDDAARAQDVLARVREQVRAPGLGSVLYVYPYGAVVVVEEPGVDGCALVYTPEVEGRLVKLPAHVLRRSR